jgi:hypothetical protein
VNDGDNLKKTVVIRRPPKASHDDRGNAVWTGTVEDVELELISTQAVEMFLQQADDADLIAIGKVADPKQEGVIVRDCATGRFEILSEAELAVIMDADQQALSDQRVRDRVTEFDSEDSSKSLTLVSTQDLLRMLNADEHDGELNDMGEDPGFDPYDRS